MEENHVFKTLLVFNIKYDYSRTYIIFDIIKKKKT